MCPVSFTTVLPQKTAADRGEYPDLVFITYSSRLPFQWRMALSYDLTVAETQYCGRTACFLFLCRYIKFTVSIPSF